MQSRIVFALPCALVVAACGGRVETATGGVGNGTGGTGGAASGAGGRGAGSGNVGGRTMGGSANSGGATGSCNPDFCAAPAGANGCCLGPNGPCGIDVGTGCREPMCQADSDCPISGPMFCLMCPNNPGPCQPIVTRCDNGLCSTLPPVCPPPPPPPICFPENCPPVSPNAKPCCLGPAGPCGADFGSGCSTNMCQTDRDCPPAPVPCMPCPDGSCAYAYPQCSGGLCIMIQNSCPPPPPSCIPENCRPGVIGTTMCCLGPEGPCGTDFGAGCTAVTCFLDQDCPPIPTPCSPCPDGSCVPTRQQCSRGTCVTAPGMCLPPPG